jgi:surface polysaccharide O-acyltransferase-like enzyme
MFLNYMNNFRGVAIVFIVAGHCLHKLNTVFSWRDAKLFYSTLSVIVSNGTVLFVFIAGFLFQHLSHKYEFGKYLKGKWQTVVLPYLVISTPMIALRVLGLVPLESPFPEQPPAVQVVLYYLTGAHMLPLWFIPMITLFYIAAPLLVRLDRDARIYYLLPLFVVVSSFVPRYDAANIPLAFVHFFPVYVLGMFCSRYRAPVLAWTERYAVLLAALFLILVAVDVYLCYVDPRFVTYVSYLNLWSKMLLAVLLMLLLYRQDQRLGKRFDFLAGVSFGLYFAHQYVIDVLGRFVPTDPGGLPARVAIYLAFTTAVTLVSVALLMLVKRMFGGRSRMLVGY